MVMNLLHESMNVFSIRTVLRTAERCCISGVVEIEPGLCEATSGYRPRRVTDELGPILPQEIGFNGIPQGRI